MAEYEPPRVEEGGGAVVKRSVKSSGIADRWIPAAFMLVVAIASGGLMYLTFPGEWRLVDNDLLIWLLSGLALVVSWWFRNVAWPDDPRKTQRREERR